MVKTVQLRLMQGVQFRSLVSVIHGRKKKITSCVSRYSTTSGRLRNKRKEGMKDERGIGFRGGNEGKGSKGVWGKVARNKLGL